jgi:hypothetical protein
MKMQDIEQAIRERAYHLWAESGHQEGHAETHWLTAQWEVLNTSLGELGRISQASTVANKPKAKASRKKKRAG